ncbi:hypothetical protein T07_8051 [Trichinella nelsoni]|uniref:Uncharacterized protein n=1 Tax=Trichinella nelsoni TaxID=6336 RepID=A0A0V0S5J7_9BILA|nr:hypothetical protein T07_8051 [Trichinella nelsoni]
MSAIKYVKSVEQPMLLTLVQRNQCCVACSRRSIEVTVTVRCCLSQIENEYFNVLVRACENESRILNAPHRISANKNRCTMYILQRSVFAHHSNYVFTNHLSSQKCYAVISVQDARWTTGLGEYEAAAVEYSPSGA